MKQQRAETHLQTEHLRQLKSLKLQRYCTLINKMEARGMECRQSERSSLSIDAYLLVVLCTCGQNTIIIGDDKAKILRQHLNK